MDAKKYCLELEQLAAMVIVLDAEDLEGLESICNRFIALKTADNISEKAAELIGKVVVELEKIQQDKTKNIDASFLKINEFISKLQKIESFDTWLDAVSDTEQVIIEPIVPKEECVETEKDTPLPIDEEEKAKTNRVDAFEMKPEKFDLENEAAAAEKMLEDMEEEAIESDQAEPSVPVTDVTPVIEEEEQVDVDLEILEEFINESSESLQVVESDLLNLEINPDDTDIINSVFRAFHSAKGTSSFLGLDKIKDLAHQTEMLLDKARRGEIKLIKEYTDLALESADILGHMLEALKTYQTGPVPVPPRGYTKLMQNLVSVGKPEAAKKIISEEKQEIVKQVEETIVAKDEPVKVDGEKPKKSLTADMTVRVSTKRLDGLIDMVGELVITNAMIAQNSYVVSESDRTLTTNIQQLSKIAREVQDLSMALRMVPLKSTFQKMERLVRDLARKSGKTVQFIIDGEETEIDRTMVESLNDPLVHMLRNAMDHGLESTDERRELGKSLAGKLKLRAYHAAGFIVIELKDDGKGLDKEKILNKAFQKGIVQEGRDLSDSEIYKLIFEPGFSTADKVTEISGRGVGMDVVKKNITAVQGKVDVTSELGTGTTFTMKIPLTLAIIDGLLLKAGSQQYIVPTLNVKQALRPSSTILSTVKGKGEVLKFRDTFIPIFRLHKLFGLKDAIEDPSAALLLVVEYEGELCALLADELLGQRQIVIKTLGEGLGKVEGVTGAAILGDGRIRLILDVGGIMKVAKGLGKLSADGLQKVAKQTTMK